MYVHGSEEHAREVLGDIDVNGDGVISYEEFKVRAGRCGDHGRQPRFVYMYVLTRIMLHGSTYILSYQAMMEQAGSSSRHSV